MYLDAITMFLLWGELELNGALSLIVVYTVIGRNSFNCCVTAF